MSPTALSRTSSMSSQAPMLVTGLPSEILIRILLLLPLKDLLAVSSSCTLFRSLYTDSAVLQYSFLLQLTHMRDASPTSVSALERYEALKSRDQRWRSLTWKRRQTVEAQNGDRGTLYDLLGGVLALGVQAPCLTLEFYKLPTTRGGSDVPHTNFTPGFIIKDFTMDPSQDLLCLIEVVAPGKGQMPAPGRARRHTYKVHLYTLSTFEAHPLAKEQVLNWPYFVTSLRSAPFISIQDGMVALHANSADEEKTEGGVAIYDWKRGVLVAAQPSSTTEIIESFSFIAPALFLVAVYNVASDRALLNLYAFDPTYSPSPPAQADQAEYSSRPTTPTVPLLAPNPSPTLIATYHLPRLLHRPNIFTIRLDPSPGVGDSVPPSAEGDEGDEIKASPMFMPDGQERLVLIDLQFVVPDMENQWQGVEERYSLFVLKSTLIKALRHFPHLDPEGSGPKLAFVAPPTPGPATASSPSARAAVVAQVEAEMPDRDSIDGSDIGEEDEEVVEEEDEGDENWEDAEEDWESEHDLDSVLDGEGNGAVQYAWQDWADRTRMLVNLPLPHAWVLFIYHCKFVHATATAIPATTGPNHLASADIAARLLDFSPNSCALLYPSQGASQFNPSPTVYVPPTPDPQPPLEKRDDGDVGRLIRGKSVVKRNMVWAEEVRTGLEYVERDAPSFMREGPEGGEERLSGLVVDEQRLVWVKRNTVTHNLVLDVHMF